MGDLVAHDRRDFIVGQFESIDQAAVDNDLATRTTVGVQLVALDQVDFPLPLRRIRPQFGRLGNQSIGDCMNPLGIGAGGVQHPFAGRLANGLLVGLGVHFVDFIRGEHAEHVLFALHTDRVATRGIDCLTPAEQQRSAQGTEGK